MNTITKLFIYILLFLTGVFAQFGQNIVQYEDYDVVLIGHYHQTEIEFSEDKSLIFMGDWLKYFTVTTLDENGWKQNNWN